MLEGGQQVEGSNSHVLILPAPLLYPSSPAEEEVAVAIHHSGRGWASAEDFRKAAIRAERRLREARGLLEAERRSHEETRRRLAELSASLQRGA